MNSLKFASYTSLLRIYLFWLLFFAIEKSLFIIIDFVMIVNAEASFYEVLQAFWYALPLDISMASYFAVVSWLILSIQNFVKLPFLNRLHQTIQIVFIVLAVLIAVGNIGIYPEWKMKLNFKALEYLTRPMEVLESNQTSKSIIEVVLIVIFASLSIWLFNKYFFRTIKRDKPSIASRLVFLILIPGFIFLGMRGGIKEIPISQSQSYYSQKDVLNDLSVNTIWNLMYSTINTFGVTDQNIFEVYPQENALNYVNVMHHVKKDTTVTILNTKRPNIIFLIMESWSADLIYDISGQPGITPRFDSLINEGLFFTKLYSSGNRSQQGLASLLGGFPALPITTLTTSPEKMRQTATITRVLNEANYHSTFYYGGQLRYGNIKAYLLHNQFDEIIEEEDINRKIKRGKLGVHDGLMFPFVLDKLNKLPQPFFANYFTLSSHSPYDHPMEDVIDMNDSEDEFHNSVYYTDSVLGDFIQNAKQQSWYDNTLIVIIADHSHQTFTHRSVYQSAYRQVPMLLLGGALKSQYHGVRYDRIASQTDVGTTLLKQLNLDASAFPWSKNLMNPYTPEFAFFELNNGFGWVRPQGSISYDQFSNRYYENTITDSIQLSESHREGASYLQVLFQEYIDL